MKAIELLGDVAGEVVCTFVRKGETGMRLFETTPFEYYPFLSSLAQSNVPSRRARWSEAGRSEAPCSEKQVPADSLNGDLQLGTSWRNDPTLLDPVVVVSFAEERLGTFHRFAPVKDQHLYQTLCERARKDLAPNKALIDWWG